ncbi:MAG: branched-chain amino acid ABC transporter permease [Synergistetes bacterium]|nr:branched-chain amino acid ABC transporter permease [Synergistota bacterium]
MVIFIIAGVLAVLPLIIKSVFFHHVLIMTLLYATLAQAWNIIGGYAGQVSFGHAVFFGIGAYTSTVLLRDFSLTPWIGAIIGGLIAVAVATVISYPTFKLRGHYFAIATFAIVEIFSELFKVWDYVEGAIGIDLPVLKEGFYNFMFYKNKLPYIYVMLAFFLFVFLLVRKLEKMRFGYYLKAIKESQEAAEAIGVNSTKYKLFAMMISAFLTALCGTFYAQYILRIEPATVMSLDVSIMIVLVAVLGGAGHLWGPLVGAAILVPLSEYTRALIGGTGKGVDLIIFGLLIMLVSTSQPRGVVGMFFSLRRRA